MQKSGFMDTAKEFAPCRGSSTGVVARVESLRGRHSAFEPRSPGGTPATNAGAGVERLFESLLSESFGA